MRAMDEGRLATSHVTLIATHYQFVSDDRFKGGMDPVTFQQFRENYAQNAPRTKERFKTLVAKGDAKFREVMEKIHHHEAVENTARWLPWLDDLGGYSYAGSAQIMANISTQIIHGEEDAVTPVAQAEAWHGRHPDMQVYHWQGVGHAPHLHDADRLRSSIANHHGAIIT